MKKSIKLPDKDTFFRRLRWLFSNSGVLALALEHFLAMVPATILVPILVNSTFETTVIDTSLVLLTSGLGTILFTIISKGKIPAYLGSSFAYIGLTIYLVQQHITPEISPHLAYVYVGWAYLFSGFILLLLSLLYKKKGIEKVLSFFLPPVVIGPAISLIGLELADTAVADSGFGIAGNLINPAVAVVTLIMILLFSLMKSKVFKNAAIIIGMLFGYGLYIILTDVPSISLTDIELFTLPHFHLPVFTMPPNLTTLFLSVIPATFIVFTENIGRVTVINQMMDNDNSDSSVFNPTSIKKMESALLSHGFSTMLAGFIGSVPNTIYAENIAIMGIHSHDAERNEPDPFIRNLTRPFSWVPYVLASCFAIAFSFIGVLHTFLLSIPKPVIGGMEMFLFGIISAPGIQLLVDKRVNYKKISNQIITAAILISGISGLSLTLGVVELKGMSLGFSVGVVLNLFVHLLKFSGKLCDAVSFDEFLVSCLSVLTKSPSSLKILDAKTEAEAEAEAATKPENPIDDSSVPVDNSAKKPEQSSVFNINSIALLDLYHLLTGRKQSIINMNLTRITSDFICDVIKHTKFMTIGEKDGKSVICIEKSENGLFIELRNDLLPPDEIQKYSNDYPDAVDVKPASDFIDVKITAADSDNPSAAYNIVSIDATKNIPMRKIKKLLSFAMDKISTPSV